MRGLAARRLLCSLSATHEVPVVATSLGARDSGATNLANVNELLETLSFQAEW